MGLHWLSLSWQPRAGNNAVEMQTTATFDARTDEFIVHSPTVLSQKYWITNGAIHAKWAVVFCQLLIGSTNQGVHGLLVRIREEVRGWYVDASTAGPAREARVLSASRPWAVSSSSDGALPTQDMTPVTGVTVEDMGHKMGLNGETLFVASRIHS